MIKGLAIIKFSGSANKLGKIRIIEINNVNVDMAPRRSFIEKYGWNGILSMFIGVPRGFDDPVLCKSVIWIITRIVKIKGVKKWSVKKRVRVGLSTENPPQSHWVIVKPTYGIAESRFVITVAPQNDIWPQGKTYPRNAVAIRVIMIVIPENQGPVNKNEE